MRRCEWSDLVEGRFHLEHIYTRRTRPRNSLQGNEARPRPANGLVLYHTGWTEVLPSGSGLQAGPGCLVYYPAGSRYRAFVDVPKTYYDQLEFILKDIEGKEVTLGDHPHVLFENCPAIYKIKLKEMADVHQNPRLASDFKSNALLYDLIYHLVIDIFTRESKLQGFQRILPAILHLEQDYSDHVTIGVLARMSNMSISGFRRLFTKYCGQSPVRYRNGLRIRRACDLLKAGQHTISEVAELTGFGSVYYFSRVFKDVTGQAPSTISQG